MTGGRALADYPDVMVQIACRKCDRRRQYQWSSLTALYSEKAALPDVLRHLANDCPKRRATMAQRREPIEQLRYPGV